MQERATGVDAASFTDADRRELAERGIGLEEALRQVALLASPSHFMTLDRACTVGDGIHVVRADERERLLAVAREAASAGRVSKFVPASGAATRMFRELLAVLGRETPATREALAGEAAGGSKEAAVTLDLLAGLERFAFHDTLAKTLAARGAGDLDALEARGEVAAILDALLSESGMDYARLPKGLLEFHRDVDGTRTAFEEQLVEAVELTRGRDGVARAHFTVSPDHRAGFAAALEACRARRGDGVRLDVTFSEQKPSTDTLAVDLEHRPFRDREGRLLFRPAGHGALIENLADTGHDLVLVKNIDNVVPDRLKAPTYEWSRLLVGLLADVQARSFALRARLDGDAGAAAVDEALAFLGETFDDAPAPSATSLAARREAARALLDRPIRVCGMVPNTGEPGGGPYFVRARDGSVGQQVVESAQVDHADPEQARRFREATHFNPVFMACALRDRHGRAWDLGRYVDPAAVIVAQKSHEGRALLALERPGLWNGAMAHWSTLFVEVPGTVFSPVKTVLDLLRPEHQSG